MRNQPLTIGNMTIQAGERVTIALPTPEIYTCAPIYMPMHVIHGKQAGPTLLICGAMHGDEVNGIAILQRLMKLRLIESLKGTLIVIPTLNIYGLITGSRNLPDRRDLEGSFPGSETGSFASRLAYFLDQNIFNKITHCIDLHTGEPHLSKFSQAKCDFSHEESLQMAKAFEAPILMNSTGKEGLLWLKHREANPIPTIVYLTGEAQRLDQRGIKVGVRGIVRVARHLGMIKVAQKKQKTPPLAKIEKEQWVRAPSSGLCEIFPNVGSYVMKGSLLARISEPFGTEHQQELYAPTDGIVLALNQLPILNEGEPIIQIGEMQQQIGQTIQDWSELEKGDVPIE